MVTLTVAEPAALGLGETVGDGDAVAGVVDFAEPDALGEADTALGAGEVAVATGAAGGDGDVGTEHAAALLAAVDAPPPVESTTCTDSLRPLALSAAVTLTRLIGWCVLLKIQRDSGAFAPRGYPLGSR
jgi:hypothetical protein